MLFSTFYLFSELISNCKMCLSVHLSFIISSCIL